MTNGITTNLSKSGIMIVRKDKRTPQYFHMHDNILGYPYVTNYKYLGIIIDDCL